MTSLLPGESDGGGPRDGLLRGLATGIVTDNIDPEGLARVRIRLPWLDDGASSQWARLAVPMAGAGYGAYFVPEVGDEVLVGAEGGDPSHLYVIGMLWNGRNAPPESNGDGRNDRRMIVSRAGHHLLLDDGEQPVVELRLKDGKRLRLDPDGMVLEDGENRLRIDTSSSVVTIQSAAALKLQSRAIAIEADQSIEIKSSGTVTLRGALVQIN